MKKTSEKITSAKSGIAKKTTKKTNAKTIKKSAANTDGPAKLAVNTIKNLMLLSSQNVAAQAQRYFKTAPGEYGAGDQFLGIRLPMLRQLSRDIARNMARDFRDTSIEVVLPLLKSGWHESRSLALMLLVKIYKRSDEKTQQRIYQLYLKNTKFINNWDLVDLSAADIVGAWLFDKDRSPLAKLAKSKSIWERRIAILATFHYIKKGEYAETLRIAKLLLKDEEDLIQKAVGWMLREVGKRVSTEVEESFLKQYYKQMPRTMLRYAIERFAEPKRRRYLRGEI